MSEYQRYEFRAIDRPLDDMDFKWARGLSTRAEVSRTHFVNTYKWGDFKGDPDKMLERCFDAFLYTSNFGICRFAIKVPRDSIDLKQANVYAHEFGCTFRKFGGGIIIHFEYQDEPGAWEETSIDDELWLSQLIPIREEIISGDWRSFYIAWLGGIRAESFGVKDIEPPVPAGLRSLTASQTALAEFLLIGPDLLKIAAKGSGRFKASATSDRQLKAHVAGMERSELERIALQVLKGEGEAARLEQIRQIAADGAKSKAAPAKRRKASAIHAEWMARVEETASKGR